MFIIVSDFDSFQALQECLKAGWEPALYWRSVGGNYCEPVSSVTLLEQPAASLAIESWAYVWTCESDGTEAAFLNDDAGLDIALHLKKLGLLLAGDYVP
jgi:hypothetical protein